MGFTHIARQIVNLIHNLRIVDYGLGHTGSVHDSYAFESTRIHQEHDQLLEPNEWIWADSAYPCNTWCVPPFKKLPGRQLTPQQKKFNYHLARVRVRSEHTIGLLKGRFQSLHELRIQVSSPKQHDWVLVWIRCCIILHNMILDIEGDGDDETWRADCVAEVFGDGDDDDDDMDNSGPAPPADEFLPESARAGFNFRQALMEEILLANYPDLLTA